MTQGTLDKLLIALITVLLLAVMTALVLHARSDSTPTPLQLEECRRRGQPIVEALLAYKTDTGSFPDSLDRLVAAGRLARIESPTWGAKEWDYTVYPNSKGTSDAFWLQVGEAPDDFYPCLYYSSGDHAWGFDN